MLKVLVFKLLETVDHSRESYDQMSDSQRQATGQEIQAVDNSHK